MARDSHETAQAFKVQILLRIRLLALSTAEVSRLARYICVVASLSWPIPSEITDKGMPLALAAEAQLWRAT